MFGCRDPPPTLLAGEGKPVKGGKNGGRCPLHHISFGPVYWAEIDEIVDGCPVEGCPYDAISRAIMREIYVRR
jgi:hypothetical protein